MSDVVGKDFFLNDNVPAWWNDEDWPSILREYFDEQVSILVSLSNWEGTTVLDAGTGFGRFSRAIAEAGASVHAVDISRGMVGTARLRTNNLVNPKWYVGDVENLPFHEETFDVVLCMETLMHVPDPSQAVRELARVTKPGGKVIFGINNRFSLHNLILSAQVHTGVYRWLRNRTSPQIHRTDTLGRLQTWVREGELNVQDVIGIGLLHPAAMQVLPGRDVSLIPPAVSRWMLNRERNSALRSSCLLRLMKAIIMVAERPKNSSLHPVI